MTAFGSVPKAQMHGEPEGTWNLEKLHLELKYLGRKVAEAKLDCLFLLGSSAAKMWTVPWSLETQMREASWLKLIQYILAACDPRRSSWIKCPDEVSNILMRVPFSDAVAILVPCRFKAIQLKTPS